MLMGFLLMKFKKTAKTDFCANGLDIDLCDLSWSPIDRASKVTYTLKI